MLRTILVPLDGSTFARHALPAARSLAQQTGATVNLVHVHVPDAGQLTAKSLVGGAHDVDDATNARQRRHEMNDLTARCCELLASDVKVGCNLLDGSIVTALIEHAQVLPADLVVMTTHGRGAFSRAWLGSVVDEFVRHCPTPTLLIRPGYAAESAPPDQDQPWRVRRMLVPLDGSPLAEQILEPAAEVAGALGAELLLLWVAGSLAGSEQHAPGADRDSLATDPAYAAERSYLDGVAGRLRARSLAVRTMVEAAQETARMILNVAQQERCELIALATRGRGGIARFVLGSVADKIVRGAELPVLLLRP